MAARRSQPARTSSAIGVPPTESLPELAAADASSLPHAAAPIDRSKVVAAITRAMNGMTFSMRRDSDLSPEKRNESCRRAFAGIDYVQGKSRARTKRWPPSANDGIVRER